MMKNLMSGWVDFIWILLRKKAWKWFGLGVWTTAILVSCFTPNLEITVENYVEPENSKYLSISFQNCAFPGAKCRSGGGVFTLIGYEKSKEVFFYSANPIYFRISGNGKIKITLKKSGSICAETLIENKSIIRNNFTIGNEYVLYCK